MTLEEYCDGCHKMVDGKCTVYEDPAKKVGANRGFSLGCSFRGSTSTTDSISPKVRVGQQKQKKSVRRKAESGWYWKKGRKSRRSNAGQT